MSILCNNLGGFSAPAAASGIATLAGSPNLRGSYSMACRVKFSAVPTTPEVMAVGIMDTASFAGAYIGRFSGDPAARWSMSRYDGGFTAQSVNVAGAYATGAWRHFALTYDATNIRGYTNGALSGTTASVTTTCPNTATCSFMMAGYGQFTIQDVVIFSRVLTLEEIQLLNVQRGAPEVLNRGDLIAWYPEYFDDRLRDWSGRNNHATANYTGGTGTAPAANNEDAGTGWIRTKGRIWVPQVTLVSFSGTATSPTATTGTLLKKPTFAGSAASPSACTGSLRVRKFFASGVSTSPTAFTGTAQSRVLFGGTTTSPTACTGTGQSRQVFAGACTSPTACTGTLQILGITSFSGTAASPTACTASMRVRKTSAGTCTSPSACTATLNVRKSSSGSATSPSACTATLRVRKFFGGTATSPTACQGMQTGGTVTAPAFPEDPRNTQKRRLIAIGHFRRRGRH